MFHFRIHQVSKKAQLLLGLFRTDGLLSSGRRSRPVPKAGSQRKAASLRVHTQPIPWVAQLSKKKPSKSWVYLELMDPFLAGGGAVPSRKPVRSARLLHFESTRNPYHGLLNSQKNAQQKLGLFRTDGLEPSILSLKVREISISFSTIQSL